MPSPPKDGRDPYGASDLDYLYVYERHQDRTWKVHRMTWRSWFE